MILEQSEERAWKRIEALSVDDRVELVRDIALRGYTDAVDLTACRALIHAFPSMSFKDTAALGAAHQVLRSLADRLIIISESALGLIKRPDDRHARVAIKALISDPLVLDAVAEHGDEGALKLAIQTWSASDIDLRRDLIKHHRNKSVAHRGVPNSDKRDPFIEEIYVISGRVASMLAFLATGTGVRTDTRSLHSDGAYQSAYAFWKPWAQG